MIQTVVKRDGRIVGFNEQKISAAIRKAMLTTDEGEDESLITSIADRISMKGKEQMTVEEIQDMVENELMKSARKEVAKAYIKYRNARNIARKAKTRDIFLEIINIKNNEVDVVLRSCSYHFLCESVDCTFVKKSRKLILVGFDSKVHILALLT